MYAAYVAGKDSRMKYFGGCDAGSTYTKCVIIDENGKIAAAVTKRSRINPVLSAKDALDEAVSQVDGLNSAEELTYLIGTGYGRNKVPFADENISEISCHAMGVHVTDPSVKAIIDIGGQDVKGIAIDTDGTVLNFAMNDKCAAGTGRFLEMTMKRVESEIDKIDIFVKDAKPAKINSMCAVFAESEIVGLLAQDIPPEDIVLGCVESICQRTAAFAQKLAPVNPKVFFSGGLAQFDVMKQSLARHLRIKEVATDPLCQYTGAIGAAVLGIQKKKR